MLEIKGYVIMKKKILFFIFGILVVFVIAFLCFGERHNVPESLTILFNKNGNISEYKTTGFSHPETKLMWTDGKDASVVVPWPHVAQNYLVRVAFDIEPFLPQKIKKQNVNVFVNDKFITKWAVDKAGVYTFDLPADFNPDNNMMNIKFEIPDAKSPKELKLSSDTRKLGLGMKRLVLSQINQDNPNNYKHYNIGHKIYFNIGGNSTLYTGAGWSTQEKDFTWTDGKDAYLNFFINDAKDKKLQLNMFGRGIFAPTDECQKITVYVNDAELTTWCFSHQDDNYVTEIPESLIESGEVQIRLHIEKPFVAKPDPRHLGAAVKNVYISQVFAAKTKVKIARWIKNKISKTSDVQPHSNEQIK